MMKVKELIIIKMKMIALKKIINIMKINVIIMIMTMMIMMIEKIECINVTVRLVSIRGGSLNWT